MIVHETSSSPLIPLIRQSIVDALEPILDIAIDVHEISRSLAKANLKNILEECSKEARSKL
jgi:DNA-binding TFAR19-related protein (PDSD5 family)